MLQQSAMQKFTQKIVQMMKDEKLFQSQGGPIILSQVYHIWYFLIKINCFVYYFLSWQHYAYLTYLSSMGSNFQETPFLLFVCLARLLKLKLLTFFFYFIFIIIYL